MTYTIRRADSEIYHLLWQLRKNRPQEFLIFLAWLRGWRHRFMN